MTNAELDGATIVLVGAFNPSIFQPFWFALQGLIPADEAESIKPAVIHPEVTDFATDWFRLQVTPQRFLAYTDKPAQAVLVRDLVIGTFSILEHTPIRSMGFNREMHFDVDVEGDWHTIGDRLAPKQFWRPLFSDQARIGLSSLTVEGKREGSRARYAHLKVQPSVKVRPRGVYVHVHEHFDADPDDPQAAYSMSALLSLIKDDWQPLLEYGERVAHAVMAIPKEKS